MTTPRDPPTASRHRRGEQQTNLGDHLLWTAAPLVYDLLPIGKALLAAGTPYSGDAASPDETAEAPPIPLYVPAGGRSLLGRLAALFPVTTMPRLNRVFDLAFDVR